MTWNVTGIEIPFTSGYSVSRSLQLSAQQSINYRPNTNKVGALSLENLYQTEGIDEVLPAISAAPCRGSHTMNSLPYFVVGDRLYRVDRTVGADLSVSYASVDLGEVLGSGKVIMASIWTGTGYEMAIVSPGEHAYSYREATGFVVSISADTNFRAPAQDVVSINGFLIFLQAGTNTIFHSEVNDITTFPALSFELVTRSPTVVGLSPYRGQLYVMGEDEILPYSFIGGNNFVFQYQPNSTIQGGLNSVYAKTIVRDSLCYLGGGKNETPSIWLTNGGTAQKISTEAIEYEIRGNAVINDSTLAGFSIDGGVYILFQVDSYAFVFDMQTGKWHQRESKLNGLSIPWRASFITKAYGQLLTGDNIDGRIGSISNSSTEYGDAVERSFTTMPFDNKGKVLKVSSLKLVMDSGFDGEVTHEWSDDGGYTWSDGLTRSSGKVGEYGREIIWDRLGYVGFSRVLKVYYIIRRKVKCK